MSKEILLLVEKCSHCFSYYDIDSGSRLHSVQLPDFPHEFVVDAAQRYALYFGRVPAGALILSTTLDPLVARDFARSHDLEYAQVWLPASAKRAMTERAMRQAGIESAAVIGFTSAIAAYGAFYIPKAYGSSIELTGNPNMALWGFLVFYLSCAALTWYAYSGPRGILHKIERAPRRSSTVPA